MAAARRLGYLHVDDRDVIDIEEVADLDPGRVVVICTGSQGEPFSALSLMAAREHKWVKLDEGDTVVLSSSLIPGQRAGDPPRGRRPVPNGRRRLPRARRRGPRQRSRGAEELRLMLSLVRPRWFIPIHGERRHLQHHARLAEEVGIPRDHVIICEDGDVVEVGERVEIVDRVQAGMTFVDGLGIGDVGRRGAARPAQAGRRRRGRRRGDVDSQTGELVGGPDIVNRGFVYEEASQDILDEARERVVLASARPRTRRSPTRRCSSRTSGACWGGTSTRSPSASR